MEPFPLVLFCEPEHQEGGGSFLHYHLHEGVAFLGLKQAFPFPEDDRVGLQVEFLQIDIVLWDAEFVDIG